VAKARTAPSRRGTEPRAKPARRRGPRIALVVAEFHRDISEVMRDAACAEAAALGATVTRTLVLPGCYETPLVADALLARRDVDAVVVLGFIERGQTLHGEVMGHVVHRALVEAGLRAKKPVGLGIIGPGATLPQAEVRKEPSARAAVRAVVRSLAALDEAR
jgi:6,7-dimethyl-8-ribityllumazine synthase